MNDALTTSNREPLNVILTTDDKDPGPWLAWSDGEWLFEWEIQSQDQGMQQPQRPPGSPKEDKVFRLPKRIVLRKAEREELVRWVKKNFAVVDVNEAADILGTVNDTIHRMVDRGDLGRVPGIRHAKIPLEHVINLSRGLKEDGSEPKCS
jgi:hypothetical protein